MKDVLKFAAAFFFTLAVMIGCAAADARADEYTRVMQCVHIDYTTWEMTLEDAFGNLWVFESEDEDFAGNVYLADMDGNGTFLNIEDDIITDLHYLYSIFD